MPPLDIQAFVIDDENEEKFAGHGISPEQVLQVLGNEHVVIRNRKQRRAVYMVIGVDDGGACIAVPIEPTHDPTVWRPITACRCKRSEWTRLE